jgi:hypothetical protein
LVKRHRLKDLNRGTFLHDFGRRLLALPSHTMRAFADQVDVQACRALLLVIAIYLLAGLVGWGFLPNPSSARPRLRMAPAILVAFTAALAAYLMLPHHLGELDLMTFYPRFAVLVVLMGIVLVPAGLGHLRGPLRLLVPVPAMLVCALYGYQLIVHYHLFARETADFVEVVHKTPPGGKAVGVPFNRSSRVMRIGRLLCGHSIRAWQHGAVGLLRNAPHTVRAKTRWRGTAGPMETRGPPPRQLRADFRLLLRAQPAGGC